ncbi:DegT/DnrJ/EryC1/StrS family aminotransferase [Dactylosporangium sp. CS-047395]|uniref:DegT/DnrJ/EryC1/StrS family aminotransferase n=1 Tax=Dactylosporangium sp. CS-047395 TaxID=3239936 RepID=UPI003D8CDCBB
MPVLDVRVPRRTRRRPDRRRRPPRGRSRTRRARGTRVRGRYAGTQNTIGSFSTHDRKLLPTGEGGFSLTHDHDLADRIDAYSHLDHLAATTTP